MAFAYVNYVAAASVRRDSIKTSGIEPIAFGPRFDLIGEHVQTIFSSRCFAIFPQSERNQIGCETAKKSLKQSVSDNKNGETGTFQLDFFQF